MASITKKGGKTPAYHIQFFRDGNSSKRETIYIGGTRYSEKTANELKTIVEKLIFCKDNDTDPDKKTVAWLEKTTPEIREKLVKAGLIETPPTHTVTELWDAFLKQKADVKGSTITIYETARDRFFAFFKGNELLKDLTQAMMQNWKDYLRTEWPREKSRRRPRKYGLAESTVAGTLTKAKAVFNWAVRSGWIETNPLTGVGRGEFVNEENDRIVTMDEYHRLLDACPCQDWRAIIALARIGGMRAPSEVLRLRWSDINWERSRFYVTSNKTERYKGKGSRLVPLFPELRIELEKLFESDSSEGAEFVINRYRDPERTNLGTQFARIVKLAGIQPIPRPFDNMRASRSIEVYAEHGEKAEAEWIGHSTEIAKKHYLRVHEGNFTRAVSKGTDWAVLGDSADYGRCSESDFERATGETPAKSAEVFYQKVQRFCPDTKTSALSSAVRSGIKPQGTASKKSKSAVNP